MELRTLVFNPFQENTYLIWDEEKNCAIIDPGCSDEHEQNQLVSFLEENGLKPIKLLNTHCHVDHVLGNKFLADKYNLKLEINEGDAPILEAVPKYGVSFGFNTGPMVEPSVFLKDGDTVMVGSVALEVIHTPGHSPGGICFYHQPSKQVVVGDTLFYGSIGRTDLPGGSHPQLINSIKTKLLTLPEDVKAHTGHGPSTSIGFEKANNPFLQ